jgi:hypothetical protein
VTRQHAIGALLSLTVLAGCSSYRVHTDYDVTADFARLYTYAWIPRSGQGPTDPLIDNDLLEKRVRAAVDAELEAKGDLLSDGTTVDFRVNYFVVVRPRTEVYAYPTYYGWGWGWGWWGGSGVYVEQYDESILVLDIVDAASNRLIWRGSAVVKLRDAPTPEELTERVNGAVHAMLERFPPPVAGE